MLIPKLNLVANFIGKSFSAVLSLILVPFYIHFLGVENYAVIGIFSLLTALASIFDGGIGVTINREIARLTAVPSSAHLIRNIFRTFEFIYWAIAIVIGLLVFFLAPFLSKYWFSSENLAVDSLRHTLFLMGIALIFQFAFSLYSSALIGLQKHVLLNLITVGMSLIKGIGAVMLLWLVAPRIELFFIWQIFVTLIQIVISAIVTWKALPQSDLRATFHLKNLSGVWRFALDIQVFNSLAIILINVDKVILSKMLSLKAFGYYCLASTIAGALSFITLPLYSTIFPRLSEFVALQDEKKIKDLYHQSCQLMSVLIFPIALTLYFFSPEILTIWTGDKEAVVNSHQIVSILALGTALNGLTSIPCALQLAQGWTKLVIYQNILAVVFIVPFMLFMAKSSGGLGVAYCWLILNACFVAITIQILHRKFLKNERLNWYIEDVALPLGAAFLVIFMGRQFFPVGVSKEPAIILLTIIVIMAFISSIIAAPFSRQWMKRAIFNR